MLSKRKRTKKNNEIYFLSLCPDTSNCLACNVTKFSLLQSNTFNIKTSFFKNVICKKMYLLIKIRLKLKILIIKTNNQMFRILNWRLSRIKEGLFMCRRLRNRKYNNKKVLDWDCIEFKIIISMNPELMKIKLELTNQKIVNNQQSLILKNKF